MEESSRNVFAFDGLLGFVVAVVVLLGALFVLMYYAIGAQNNHASDYYDIQDEKSIKMFDKDNDKHIIDFKGV
ncbi:DUF4006 family protein [Sulfurimonas sp. SAG-AH-194-L11]|nr:DUF4006 family protein [Sulfurimonas sp. SAG-AH-194-L11]MDF1878010.1 DUF4006 family protein [Sulfurimonas sp. SAG-AH-194-L11]